MLTAASYINQDGVSMFSDSEDFGIDRVRSHHEVDKVKSANAWVWMLSTQAKC